MDTIGGRGDDCADHGIGSVQQPDGHACADRHAACANHRTGNYCARNDRANGCANGCADNRTDAGGNP